MQPDKHKYPPLKRLDRREGELSSTKIFGIAVPHRGGKLKGKHLEVYKCKV